jgi:hypothetical protein
MACCGQKRQQIRTQATPIGRPDSQPKNSGTKESSIHREGIKFQYVGKTAMIAMGLMSGQQYRFASPGAIVQVDPRDTASLGAIPNLRQVTTAGN